MSSKVDFGFHDPANVASSLYGRDIAKKKEVAELKLHDREGKGGTFTVKISFDKGTGIDAARNKAQSVLHDKMVELKTYAEALKAGGFGEAEFVLHRNGKVSVIVEGETRDLERIKQEDFWKSQIKKQDHLKREGQTVSAQIRIDRLNQAAKGVFGDGWKMKGAKKAASAAKHQAQGELAITSKFTAKLDSKYPNLDESQRSRIKEAYFNHLLAAKQGDYQKYKQYSDELTKLASDYVGTDEAQNFKGICDFAAQEDLATFVKSFESDFKHSNANDRPSSFSESLRSLVSPSLHALLLKAESTTRDKSVNGVLEASKGVASAPTIEDLAAHTGKSAPGLETSLKLVTADSLMKGFPKFTKENAAKAVEEYAKKAGRPPVLNMELVEKNLKDKFTSSQRAEFQMLYLKFVTSSSLEEREAGVKLLNKFYDGLGFEKQSVDFLKKSVADLQLSDRLQPLPQAKPVAATQAKASRTVFDEEIEMPKKTPTFGPQPIPKLFRTPTGPQAGQNPQQAPGTKEVK